MFHVKQRLPATGRRRRRFGRMCGDRCRKRWRQGRDVGADVQTGLRQQDDGGQDARWAGSSPCRRDRDGWRAPGSSVQGDRLLAGLPAGRRKDRRQARQDEVRGHGQTCRMSFGPKPGHEKAPPPLAAFSRWGMRRCAVHCHAADAVVRMSETYVADGAGCLGDAAPHGAAGVDVCGVSADVPLFRTRLSKVSRVPPPSSRP